MVFDIRIYLGPILLCLATFVAGLQMDHKALAGCTSLDRT